jgi:P-type conjugative transfer protein TrbJ
MKTLTASLALLICALATSIPAHAQWVVFDPSNFVENVMTEVNSVTQIENQVMQLEHEAQMLLNQGQNLKGLNFTALNQLRVTLGTTSRLLDQAQGMAFDLTRTQQQLARLYPAAYGTTAPRTQLNADALARWSSSHEALSTAMQVQAQAKQNFPADVAVLGEVMSRSSSAVGALQGIQATNELLGLQARQLMQSQQLAISHDRAAALEEARAVEAEARSRELRNRFMTATTPYTAESVHLSP